LPIVLLKLKEVFRECRGALAKKTVVDSGGWPIAYGSLLYSHGYLGLALCRGLLFR
jgi:hypothetical protein